MPWQEVSAVSLREEFVTLAQQPGTIVRELCRRYTITPRTGYKWLRRFQGEGPAGLRDRSRRPHHASDQTAPELEAAVLEVRSRHPAWGGRKIRAWLQQHGTMRPPCASTITEVLRRHGFLDPAETAKHRAWQRFEHPEPNRLWQMDFKGHFALATERCHPLTVLDDHSRFALGLEACANERGATVQQRLTAIFRRYGLPERMLMDNGGPWAGDGEHPHTPFTVWLLRLGIEVGHGRAYHPQTQGKDERFHRTLVAEVLSGRTFRDLAHCQAAFDRWRDIYNLERPHEALAMQPPALRYRLSTRPFPETLPPLAYGPSDRVRKVQGRGEVHFQGRVFLIGKGFRGQPVALRPTKDETIWEVYFHYHPITQVDLTKPVQW